MQSLFSSCSAVHLTLEKDKPRRRVRHHGRNTDNMWATITAYRRDTIVSMELLGRQVTVAVEAASRTGSLADAMSALQGILKYVKENVTA